MLRSLLHPAAPPQDADDAATVETQIASAHDDSVADDDLSGEPIILPPAKDSMTMLTEQYIAATNEKPGELNWRAVEVLLSGATGVPASVGLATKNAATSAASE